MTANKQKGLDFVAKSSTESDILIQGEISRHSPVNAKAIKEILSSSLASGINKINVIIGSNGGSIFEGYAIYNTLVTSPITIHTIAQSHALSMAAIILQAGTKRFIYENAKVMIHSGKGGVAGSATDIISYGEFLKDVNDSMAETYAKNTGKSKEWILSNWMKDGEDTWFNARDAKKHNLVDEIIEHSNRSIFSSNASFMEMAAQFNPPGIKNSWSYKEWQDNDPSGLEEMRQKEPDKFIALVRGQYGSKVAHSVASGIREDQLSNYRPEQSKEEEIQNLLQKLINPQDQMRLEDVPAGELDSWAQDNPDLFLNLCRKKYGINSQAFQAIKRDFNKRLNR